MAVVLEICVTWTRNVFLMKDNSVARVRKAGVEMAKPALVSILNCKHEVIKALGLVKSQHYVSDKHLWNLNKQISMF